MSSCSPARSSQTTASFGSDPPPAYRAHSQKYIGIGQRIATARSHQKVASARSTAATAGHASIPAATVTRASSSNPSLKCPQLAINTVMKTSDPGTLLTKVKLSTGDIIACPSAMRSYTATPHKYLHRTAPLLHRTTPLLHRTAPLLQLPHGGCAAVRAAIELRTGCPAPPAGSVVKTTITRRSPNDDHPEQLFARTKPLVELPTRLVQS